MFDKLIKKMLPITLSRGLEIVEDISPKGNRDEHWCAFPVRSLIDIAGDIPAREVTSEHIHQWYRETARRPSGRNQNKPLSVFTVNSYARALIGYFNHLKRIGYISSNPCADLRLPKLPRKPRKDIPEADIERIVQYADRNTRDRALVLVLRDTGCRIGGLASMTVSGVRFEELQPENGPSSSGAQLRGRALVGEKMNKLRWVYFGDEASRALQRYINIRHHNAGDELWLTHSGRPLSKSGIYQVFKRIGKQAGVERFNPHAFRHSCAKRLLNNGAPPKVVQELLGHENVVTTMSLYLQYDEDELADLHSQFNS
jgi:site-specific recombinase XerD